VTKATETDLFPWILGVFLIAASAIVAVVATGGLTHSHMAMSAAASIIATAKSRAAASPPTSATRPPLPRDQVWQCVVNGQKTFSDSPCRNGASVRQLNQVNRMDAVAVPVPTPSYNLPAPEYSPAFADPNTVDDGNDSHLCQTLKAEVRAINERMRHAYTLPDGEYFRARLREISDLQYERACLR
jgi:hypothetical protein